MATSNKRKRLMIMESSSDSEQDEVKKDLVLRAVNGNKTSDVNGRPKKKMKQEERHVDSDDDEDDEENDEEEVEKVTDDESLKKCLLSATYISRSNDKRSPEKKRLKQEDIDEDEDDDGDDDNQNSFEEEKSDDESSMTGLPSAAYRNGNGRPNRNGLMQEEIGSYDGDDDDDDDVNIVEKEESDADDESTKKDLPSATYKNGIGRQEKKGLKQEEIDDGDDDENDVDEEESDTDADFPKKEPSAAYNNKTKDVRILERNRLKQEELDSDDDAKDDDEEKVVEEEEDFSDNQDVVEDSSVMTSTSKQSKTRSKVDSPKMTPEAAAQGVADSSNEDNGDSCKSSSDSDEPLSKTQERLSPINKYSKASSKSEDETDEEYVTCVPKRKHLSKQRQKLEASKDKCSSGKKNKLRHQKGIESEEENTDESYLPVKEQTLKKMSGSKEKKRNISKVSKVGSAVSDSASNSESDSDCTIKSTLKSRSISKTKSRNLKLASPKRKSSKLKASRGSESVDIGEKENSVSKSKKSKSPVRKTKSLKSEKSETDSECDSDDQVLASKIKRSSKKESCTFSPKLKKIEQVRSKTPSGNKDKATPNNFDSSSDEEEVVSKKRKLKHKSLWEENKSLQKSVQKKKQTVKAYNSSSEDESSKSKKSKSPVQKTKLLKSESDSEIDSDEEVLTSKMKRNSKKESHTFSPKLKITVRSKKPSGNKDRVRPNNLDSSSDEEEVSKKRQIKHKSPKEENKNLQKSVQKKKKTVNSSSEDEDSAVETKVQYGAGSKTSQKKVILESNSDSNDDSVSDDNNNYPVLKISSSGKKASKKLENTKKCQDKDDIRHGRSSGKKTQKANGGRPNKRTDDSDDTDSSTLSSGLSISSLSSADEQEEKHRVKKTKKENDSRGKKDAKKRRGSTASDESVRRDSTKGGANSKPPSQKESKRLQLFKRFVRLCGLRVAYVKLFANVKKEAKKITILHNVLRDAGMQGNPTLTKCRQLKEKRDEIAELEALNRDNIIQGNSETGRSRRRNVHSKYLKCTPDDRQSSPSPDRIRPVDHFANLRGIISDESDSD